MSDHAREKTPSQPQFAAPREEQEKAQCPDCDGTGQRYYAREVTDGCDRCNATGFMALSTPSPVSPQKEKVEARVDDSQYPSNPLATAADAGAASERWDNDDRGLLDDVVVPDVATFRLERMNDRGWWIGLYRRDGTLIHIDVFGEGRRIDARRRED